MPAGEERGKVMLLRLPASPCRPVANKHVHDIPGNQLAAAEHGFKERPLKASDKTGSACPAHSANGLPELVDDTIRATDGGGTKALRRGRHRRQFVGLPDIILVAESHPPT